MEKMINLDDVPDITDHPYRIIIVGGSGFGKMNSLLNLICHQPNIYKI